VNERTVTFGPDAGLCGVMTEPDKAVEYPNAPIVLMWNVGLNHHVGPRRFNVELARALARRGVSSLRFDLAGLGDSEARRDTRSDHERAMSDVRDAMAYMEKRRGARTFILVGFCSSVDAAHIVSVEDERVVGMVYLEGYAYRTRGFWLRYPLRLIDPPRIKRFLKGALPDIFGHELTGTGWRNPGGVFAREYPTTERLVEDYARMVREGKRLLFVYVGGDTNYNHQSQLFEMYVDAGMREKLELEYYGGMDHTFFLVQDRRRVIAKVTRFICDPLPVRGRASEETTQAAAQLPPEAEAAS
jgi:dienelactone hydrolase